MKKRIGSIIAVLALLLTLCPGRALAASGTTHRVSSENDFLAALKAAQPGDTVQIEGSVYIVNPDSNNAPFIIDKQVTITGGELINGYGGILLGADVAFENIVLKFPNHVRNAILANGHVLTLNNVSWNQAAQNVHLFCGGMTGGSVDAAQGDCGQVVISGSTSLGNIYAGSISSDANSNCFDKPAVISIDSSATGKMGNVYACGALETPDKSNWFDFEQVAPPTASAQQFPVTGSVTIRLYRNVAGTVDGETGSRRNADVEFTGTDYRSDLLLKNISGLSVKAGSLAALDGSSFGDDAGEVSVPAGTTLDLSGFDSKSAVSSFSGGGTLILGQKQTLSISGSVAGTTVFALGLISPDPLVADHVYIVAPQSVENSFQLAPNSPSSVSLKYNLNGTWTGSSGGPHDDKVIVESLNPASEVKADAGSLEAEIRLHPKFVENNALPYLNSIPLTITVGEETALPSDEDPYYLYTTSLFRLTVTDDDTLYLENIDGISPIADGVYTVTVSVPADHTAANQALTSTVTLTVGEESDTPVLYAVTVEDSYAGSTGAGSYAEGDTVSISAGTRSGYTFTGWRAAGVSLSASGSADTSFVMPGNDVTVTALWQASGSGSESGSGGSGSGSGGSSGGETSLPVTTGGSGAVETKASPDAAVSGGTAVASVSDEMAAEIVRQAAAGGSGQVVIAPVIAGKVTKAEVSLPAALVEGIGGDTNADLAVHTSVAEVRIPHAGVEQLARSGGAAVVTVECQSSAAELSITAGGRPVTGVSGGVKLTVPYGHCGPGVVAVLVKADGARQVVRKSFANTGAGTVCVPLDGSARLEIVDNSKAFADLPTAAWAAKAVTFASSHELFNGTSATAFTPNGLMTRGMLATVLHNLESNPKHSLDSSFADVTSNAWFTEAVCWAAESGIVSGYDDGRFGAGDNITREQLAAMLYRHAGRPETSGKLDGFTDSGKVSGYAVPALRWALEQGIISGKGGGVLDPVGKATRAEAASMLMRYCEKLQ